MKALFSRYHPRYMRSLVYMLQASEYNIRDYLAWYGRTRDFSRVEKRKRLEKTPKALALLAVSWAAVLIVGAIVVAGILAADNMSHVAAVGLLITFPFVLPYVLAVAILVLRVIQWPVERYITSQAARALARHPAVKIAIAGSFGKTSMREILKTVLAEGKKVAAPPGSYNTPLGIAQFVRTLSGDEDVLIFEFGEYYPGDVRKLCELVEPHLGIITGINEAHLEKFKTIERTAATIFELADYYPGDVRKLCELVEPHLGIITGINEAHLEKFKTIERTAATIFELAD